MYEYEVEVEHLEDGKRVFVDTGGQMLLVQILQEYLRKAEDSPWDQYMKFSAELIRKL